MFFDYFVIAVRNLKRRGMRTLLTLIGILIGITAVVSLVSLGQGFEKAINSQFEEMGSDKIIISAGSGRSMANMMSGGGANPLRDGDLKVVKSVKGVKNAAGMSLGVTRVKFKDSTKYTYFAGYPTDSSKRIVESMQNMKIFKGRDLRQNDKYKILIGSDLYNGNFFNQKKVKIGDKININNHDFKVVGFFSPIGSSQDDSTIIAPLETTRNVLDKGDSLDIIITQVLHGEDIKHVKGNIEKSLRHYRDVKKGQEDFTVKTTDDLLKSFQVILTAVQIVFIGIAAISLVVGGIGIMNSMFTSVLERTNEIGVLKAIGAKNSDILWIFLIESGLLGLVGGILGILVGIGISKSIQIITTAALGMEYLKAYFPMPLILGTLAFSFIIGSLSGILPAIRASKMNPTDALRYE